MSELWTGCPNLKQTTLGTKEKANSNWKTNLFIQPFLILVGYNALTSDTLPQTLLFTKYIFLQVKNNFATIMNELPVLILFQLLNIDLLFCSLSTASTKCVDLERRS